MLQVALNGNRSSTESDDVPVTVDQLVEDALACHALGAASVHLHPRLPDGTPSLSAHAVDPVIARIRAEAPGLELSISTIDGLDLGGAPDRASALGALTHQPDVVSINLAEAGAEELGSVARQLGIGIEAGVWSVDDAEALLEAPWAADITRALIEIEDDALDADDAIHLAEQVDEVVARLHGVDRLWHGLGQTTWAIVEEGLARGHQVRVGLEDTLTGPDGTPLGNRGQIAAVAGVN